MTKKIIRNCLPNPVAESLYDGIRKSGSLFASSAFPGREFKNLTKAESIFLV